MACGLNIMNQVFWPGVVAVGGMYSVFACVGWLAARKTRGGQPSDLLVAGRAMPLWVATLTMTATWVDGGYLLGTAEAAYKDTLATALQPGVCFGISLILGGWFFAKTMRRHEFTTLIDPFEARFGREWAAVLAAPAMLGEVFWSAELLVALGSTFGVILGLPLWIAIVLSACVVTFYTMLGGVWSVAYTDVCQLALIPIGLVVALPVAFHAAGGVERAFEHYRLTKPSASDRLLPPIVPVEPTWAGPEIVRWWDAAFMLMLGGIPWNCYFQRVLSCESPNRARWHSIIAGVLTVMLTGPPLLLGVAAFGFPWSPSDAALLERETANTLPLLFARLVPWMIGVLGLGAIVGAVTSSLSSSILSAASMFGWNVYYRLVTPNAKPVQTGRVIRGTVVLFGAAAAVMALKVQSVFELWIFTSDLIYVLLFPQLVMALYDPRVNRIGSIVAFAVSLVLRLGGGEPLFHWKPLIPYPEWFAAISGPPGDWYDSAGYLRFPFKTLAAGAGLVLLPLVSRLTARWDFPRSLQETPAVNPGEHVKRQMRSMA